MDHRIDCYEGPPATVPRDALDFMSAPALRALARFHRQIANSLEAEAEAKEAGAAETRQRHDQREQLRATYGLALSLQDQGHDLDGALNMLAMQLGAPLHQIRAWYELGGKRSSKLKRARRNREIARLARQGLTNAEIGARVDPPMHPKSVARILRTAAIEPEPIPAVGQPQRRSVDAA